MILLKQKTVKKRLKQEFKRLKRLCLEEILYHWDNVFDGIEFRKNDRTVELVKETLKELEGEGEILFSPSRSTPDNPEYVSKIEREVFYGK